MRIGGLRKDAPEKASSKHSLFLIDTALIEN
jgi:hypothetical protein